MFRKTPRRLLICAFVALLSSIFCADAGLAQSSNFTLSCSLEHGAIGENADGVVVLKVEGGVTPYKKVNVESTSDGTTQSIEIDPTTLPKITISDLATGEYTITVIDGRGNTVECTITVPERIILEEGEECVTLGEELKNDGTCCYRWEEEGDPEEESISQDSEVEVCPTEETIYTVVMTDGLNIIGEQQFEVEPCNLDLSVSDEAVVLCNGSSKVVTANSIGTGVNYIWTDEIGTVIGTDEEIIFSEPGTYTLSVTSSDGMGCSKSIVVADGEDAFSISKMLEELGFVCKEAEITEYGLNPSLGNLEKLNDLIYSLGDCQNLGYMIDEIEYSPQEILQEFTELLSSDEFPDVITRAVVSCNVGLCTDDFSKILEDINDSDLGIWQHIWQSPDPNISDRVCTYIKFPQSDEHDCPDSDVEDIIINNWEDLENQSMNLLDYDYTVVQRSFAPWHTFGDLTPIIFDACCGDNRGFSLDNIEIDNVTDGATSRLNHSLDISLSMDGYTNPYVVSNETNCRVNFFGAWDQATALNTTYSEYENGELYMHMEGDDPLIFHFSPNSNSPIVPDIDARTKLYFNVIERGNKQFLSIKGVMLHKGFPAHELFIKDSAGNSVFLYTSAPFHKRLILFSLGFPGYDGGAWIDVEVEIDESGNFVPDGEIKAWIDETIVETYPEECDLLEIWFDPIIPSIPFEGTTDTWNASNISKPPSGDCNESGEFPCEQDNRPNIPCN